MKNLKKFMGVYAKELYEAVLFHPGDYPYGVDKVPEVAARMEDALSKNPPFFFKEGMAMRMTCKKLNISHTYDGIKEYLIKNHELESKVNI